MRRILTITLSALLLTGCADVSYDKAAVPDARAAVRQAGEGCKARLAAHDIKTYSEMAACGLAAERAYFAAVKLKSMDTFEAYAASYRTLAQDRDAQRISDRQASVRANKMLREFYQACNCDPNPSRLKGAPAAELSGYGWPQLSYNPPSAPSPSQP